MARKKTPRSAYWGGRGPRYAQRKYARSTGIPRKRRGPRLKARGRSLLSMLGLRR